jgi:RNA polymerase sigma-70 factor (ECF subfamily)
MTSKSLDPTIRGEGSVAELDHTMGVPAGKSGDPGNVVRPRAFQPDDAALVAALRRGDEVARRLLFERHALHVTRVLARLLGADGELADLVHDVFVMALRDLHCLQDASALKAWLTSVTVHLARGHIRKKTRRRWLRFVAPHELPDAPAATADSDVRDAARRLYRVLDTLPEDERIAFALRFVDCMELRDVAEACDVSLATIKRRLERAEEKFVARVRKDVVLAGWLEGGARWGIP